MELIEIETLTSKQQETIQKIKEICANNRLLSDRINALRKSGFGVYSAPVLNGGGIGAAIKMHSGQIRIRISSVWGAKYGNYALVVSI